MMPPFTDYQTKVYACIPDDPNEGITIKQIAHLMYVDGQPHRPPIVRTLYKLAEMGLVVERQRQGAFWWHRVERVIQ